MESWKKPEDTTLVPGIVPPLPGQTVHYLCHACGERFSKKSPFLKFLVKCPKCGSSRVVKDPAIVC